jgi:hypothetical protein
MALSERASENEAKRRNKRRRGNSGGVKGKQLKVARTPRQSEIKDRQRKAAGLSGGGRGGSTKVKSHTRKGRRVAEHQRKVNPAGGRSRGAKIPKAKVATTGRKAQVVGLGTPAERAAARKVPKKKQSQGAQGRGAIKAQLATAGSKYAKKAIKRPGKTKDHTNAGLHRIGKSGNDYVDKSGKLYHRSKGGVFKAGASKKGAKTLRKAHTAQRSHDTAQRWNRQDDRTRIRNVKKAKVPKGYMMHEDASIGRKLPGSKPTKIKAKVKTKKTRRRRR